MKMSIVYVVTGLNAIPLNGVDREALSSVNMNVLHPCRCVVERRKSFCQGITCETANRMGEKAWEHSGSDFFLE